MIHQTWVIILHVQNFSRAVEVKGSGSGVGLIQFLRRNLPRYGNGRRSAVVPSNIGLRRNVNCISAGGRFGNVAAQNVNGRVEIGNVGRLSGTVVNDIADLSKAGGLFLA